MYKKRTKKSETIQSSEELRAVVNNLGNFGQERQLTEELKEEVIKHVAICGTLKYASNRVGVTVRVIQEEIRKSLLFKKRINEAVKIGREAVADRAVEMLRQAAFLEAGLDKSALTANLALANAYSDGFRTQKVEHEVRGSVRVITAVPRPKYIEAPKVKELAEPIHSDISERVIEGQYQVKDAEAA